MLPRPLLAALAVVTLASIVPIVPASADEVIPPRSIGRKFPVGQWCQPPVSISFTPPGGSVIVHFDAQVYVEDTQSGGQLTWTGQAIDNFYVATTAQVAANMVSSLQGSCEFCYIPDGDGIPEPDEPANYFNFSAVTPVLLDQFDTNPGLRGWDLSNGGYYLDAPTPSIPAFSAAHNSADCSGENSGGSLGLGPESTPPSLATVATTSITVNGLTPGTSYDLGAFWHAEFTEFNLPDRTLLTVRIETPNGSPVARKSWGGVKSQYK